MRGPVVAIVADSADEQVEIRDPEQTYVFALAAVTAVLERGGRILVAADAALTTSLLIAASMYAAEPELERGEARSEPPVILASFPDRDSVESRLLRSRMNDDDEQDEARRSTLQEFIAGNVVEDADLDLGSALQNYDVVALLAIGADRRLRPLLAEAERYSYERRIRLVNFTGADLNANRWSDVNERVQAFLETPPRLEGQTLREEDNEALREVMFEAAKEAAFVLAIDAVVAETLGSDESGPEPVLLRA